MNSLVSRKEILRVTCRLLKLRRQSIDFVVGDSGHVDSRIAEFEVLNRTSRKIQLHRKGDCIRF